VFEDAANVVCQSSTLNFATMYEPVNPYTDCTPKEIVERVVTLPTFSWNSTSSTIWSGSPLSALVANSQTIRNVLGNLIGTNPGMFRYMRCNFRVTVRVNSTQYHQGTIIVGWLPVELPTVQYTSLQSTFAHNAVVLSASSQESCTLDIPFYSRYPHYDLFNPLNVPLIYIKAFNPLLTSSSSVVDTVPITVFLQATDVKLYGILQQTGGIARTQEMLESTERYEKHSAVNKNKKNKEAKAKEEGLSLAGPLSLIKPLIRSIPFAAPIIDTAKMILSNLDKPTSDQSLVYTQPRSMRGWSLLSGLDYGEPLSSFPSFSVARTLGMDSSDMTIVSFCQKPLLYYTGTITTAGRIFSLQVHPMFYGSWRTEPDFLAFGTSFFSYYRGSIRYLLHFVGTPFFSMRVKISVTHSGISPTSTGDGSGYYSRVIDVKGDAWVPISVPYLTPTIWSKTLITADGAQTYLILEALTDVQGSSLPAAASYYVNVYRAAGDDYQLASLTRSRNMTMAFDETEIYEKHSISQKFKEPFEGVSPVNTGFTESGLCMADTSSTITDSCKRWTSIVATARNRGSYPCGDGQLDVHNEGPFFLWSRVFAFWRGGRRVRIMNFNQSRAVLDGLFGSTDTVKLGLEGQSVVWNEAAGAGYFNASVPYYSTTSWSPAMGITAYTPSYDDPEFPTVPVGVGGGESIVISAADDFVFMYPVAPVVTALFLNGQKRRKEMKVPLVPNVVPKQITAISNKRCS